MMRSSEDASRHADVCDNGSSLDVVDKTLNFLSPEVHDDFGWVSLPDDGTGSFSLGYRKQRGPCPMFTQLKFSACLTLDNGTNRCADAIFLPSCCFIWYGEALGLEAGPQFGPNANIKG